MKIFYVAPLNSVHSVRWISFFAKKGYEIHVLNGDFDGKDLLTPSLPAGSTKVYSIPLTGSRIPVVKILFRLRRFFSNVRKLLEEVQPDVIHAHWLGLHSYAVARAGKKPVLVTPWGSDLLISPGESIRQKMIVKYVLQTADYFCCDAKHLKEKLISYGIRSSQVEIINFGIDTSTFNPSRRDASLKASLGFPDDAVMVISLRGLYKVYDITTLIRAIPKVNAARNNARYIIVGDGDERRVLEKLADDLSVRHLVRFTGRLSNEDLVRYTASADIYVSTSLSDGGIASSTAEAMACEVPVVITDFGENSDWLEGERVGYAFPLKDHEALAKHLIRLISDEDLRRHMGSEGRSVIISRNDFKNEMEKVDRLYKRLSAEYNTARNA
jgi:glycosyltransferase involved in cell wall biosynthesis